MANTITVTTSTLRTKASELRQSNGQLKTQIENLTTEEAALNQMWDGSANDAFHAAFQSDVTQMTNFYNEIEKYAVALEEIASQYETTEQTIQGIASTRKYK